MYKAIVGIVRFFIKLFCGLEVHGLENIPARGGAIIAANHTTWFDPVAIAISVGRPVHFMAKVELFRNPLFSWFFTRVYAFPVKRGAADRDAIRTAQRRVLEGHLLGIFPEGTRNLSKEKLLPLQGGAALIALKTGVPVIPTVTFGANPVRWRQKIKVVIGEPIDLGGPRRANKPAVAEASSVISRQFSTLLRRNN